MVYIGQMMCFKIARQIQAAFLFMVSDSPCFSVFFAHSRTVFLTPKRGIGLVILEIAMEHYQIFIDSLLLLLSINRQFCHRVPEGRSSDIMIFISKSNMEKNANPQCFFF